MALDNRIQTFKGYLSAGASTQLTIPSLDLLPVGFCLQEQLGVVYGKLAE